jgi:outer membrane protein TolC
MAELRAALLQAQQEVEQATAALHALIDEMELDQPLAP